jgi:uncharacterized protein
MAPDGTPLHEQLHFDLARGEVSHGPRRYVVLRADVLMGVFDGLPAPEREHALQALAASVERFGADSVRAYLAQSGAGALLQQMEAASASLGWGRWQLQAGADVLRLTVDNSPFAASTRSTSGTACHAITGMLSALASALWQGERVMARELRCACAQAGADRRCVFEAFRI